ncbi:MAG: helix-turn-helix domain-containing protein [Phycisphaeraceae bacterium]
MARTLEQTFRSHRLAELTRQLLHAGVERRAAQVRRAEKLHDQIDPERAYPLEFVIYRLTGYRRDVGDNALIVGEALRPDLRLMIDALTRSITFEPEPGETHETAAALAERMGVSTKTITRWRREGLRWRWAVPAGKPRAQVVFTADAVADFVRRHPDRVARAAAFTHIDAALRGRIIERARRLAEQRDVSLNQVAQHLARRTGRALETIRQVLEKHDREHAEAPLFVDRTGPLTPHQKRLIARAHRMGMPASRLARRFGRTRSTIHRVVGQQRASAARRVELAWIELPTFRRDDADEVILRPTGGNDGDADALHDDEAGGKGAGKGGAATVVKARSVPDRVLAELPEALQTLYRTPIMAPTESRSLFIRYNYLKFKAERIRQGLDRLEPRRGELDAFDACVREARAIRDTLARAHLPVVLLAARRHLLGDDEPSARQLVGLLERGQVVLIEAVDTFNPTRGTFESFLTNRLLQRFAAETQPRDEARAQRRLTGEEMRDRLVRSAAAAGVDVTTPRDGSP